MAKVKNTGGQPRGFNTEDGGHVVVPPGSEAEFNMTEDDFNHLKKLVEGLDDPKPFELSGSAGGVEQKKKEKKEGDIETPAQSTEPPIPVASPVIATPQTDRERREQREQREQREPRSGQRHEEGGHRSR